VPDGLPSAILRALGKEALCRVPKKHSAMSSAKKTLDKKETLGK
jgi:hypothetical protein